MNPTEIKELKDLEDSVFSLLPELRKEDFEKLAETFRMAMFRVESIMEHNEFLSRYNVYLKKQENGFGQFRFDLDFYERTK